MLASLLLAAAFQVGPFYEQKPDAAALRPFWSQEGEATDFLWPLYTSHRDWWRFLFFIHSQENDRGSQFEVMPFWFNGSVGDESYWGLFPLWGSHPHCLLMYDINFAFWPLWTRYSMPRPGEQRMMETKAVCWPLVHWRDDGSWGVWPLYVCNHQRDSFHQSALWPIVSWASYQEDRDTAGAGSSWMVWPLAGGVTRSREDQWLFLPPLFSYAKTRTKDGVDQSWRLHAPWPLVDLQFSPVKERISIFPFYESVELKSYAPSTSTSSLHLDSPSTSTCRRFGWRLIELYDDETRVFPFWVSRTDDTYFRLWPFWESQVGEDGVRRGRFLSLFPIRNVPAVDRNWAKYWTFYERAEKTDVTEHSLFWGIIRWSTEND